MIVKEAKLKTNKGVGPGDFIIYSANKRISFAKVERIEEDKILKVNKEKINEDLIEVVVCESTMDSVLNKIELIELFIQDNILSFNTNGFDRKAQLAHLLQKGNVEIISVKLKDPSE